jgi:hypothetical protein
LPYFIFAGDTNLIVFIIFSPETALAGVLWRFDVRLQIAAFEAAARELSVTRQESRLCHDWGGIDTETYFMLSGPYCLMR